MKTVDEVATPVGFTFDEFIENCCRCMRLLISAGAAIDQTNTDGFTALMYACGWNIRLAETLIQAGANVKVCTNAMVSALFLAVERNKPDVVEMLLQRDTDIDAVYVVNGWTPLHYCYDRYLYW